MPYADQRVARRGGAAAATFFPATGNERNEQIIAGGLPDHTEATRRGTGWSTMAILAVAGLVVRPTTVAAIEIANTNTTGGASLVVDDVFTFNLVASAIQGTYSIWAQVAKTVAVPSAGANITINGNNGKAYSGSAIVGISTTTTSSGWRPYGPGIPFGLGTATPGGAICAPINGKLIVPPGFSLCLHTVSQTTAWTFQNGASWYEEVISNE